ncbi:Fanconi anemia group D2 protein-like isoform X1 [Dreissena polymorpha]|uniref:Fanconi anemia group D2 protein-like isoform X1 n=1 Tax=Dreissena polymorpha TaxID=45954 RepID=UPI002264027A|nr:Fanconi anemia group D2 protein-like isoform X1 [Dreissena polymorpha]XP_052284225.1 Fanconi anemia group D2 protein-like isoform X1 [Dreissena polymorpha]
MVLERSVLQKRKAADNKKAPQPKKNKSLDDDSDDYKSSSLFYLSCRSAGLHLKNGHKYNVLGADQAMVQKNLTKELKSKGGADVVEKFAEGFEEYIENAARFHKSLLPSVTDSECQSARACLQGSAVKILLGVDLIQTSLMRVLCEKLPEFTGEKDSTILEQGQKVNVPHLLLSQFQWLDHIVNGKEVTEKLLEMLTCSCDEVQREIINCLPYIVQDSEHTTVATALRDILAENKQLSIPILDALSNLVLPSTLLAEIRDSVLQLLASVDLDDLPVLVKFLLQSVTSQDCLEVASELRKNLEFDWSTAVSSSKKSGAAISDGYKQDVESVVLDTLKSAVRFQRHVGDALIKAIEQEKQPSNHKVIDLFMLLILHGTPRKKAVESLFRNKIRAGCFNEVYLKKVFSVHSLVLKGYFQSLLKLSEVLLRSPELPVSYFGCSLYKHCFIAFEPYHRQEIVGNMVEHIGSGFEAEIDASLDILADLVTHHLNKVAPFAILVKSMLDYLDNLSVGQIRKLYVILSALAFKNANEGGLIQDDLHIVIRKQLSNNNPKYKRMGVIGAVMIVTCVAEKSQPAGPESSGNSSTPDTLEADLYNQVVSLLTLVRSSSAKSPEAYALFLDELSSIVAQGKLVSNVESWISENLTVDFQESFVVDIEDNKPTESGNIPMDCLYGLDDDTEGALAINILPLVVQKCGRKTALTAYTESSLTDPLCLAPSVRLLRVCEERQHGTLDNIDALLGCAVFLTRETVYEKLDPLSQREKNIIVSSLFYTINWFIEVVNGFAGQSDPEIKAKVITRLQNITEMQKILLKCLAVYPTFKPQLANFDLDESLKPVTHSVTTGKGDSKKGKKAKKPKKGDKTPDDADDTSRDSSQLNETAAGSTQAGDKDGTENGAKEKPSLTSLAAYKPYFRELDIKVFTILATGSIKNVLLDSEENTKAVTELSLQMPQIQFLMEDLCRKLEHSLLASASKRKTFFKSKGDKKVGFSNLDQLTPLQVATNAVKLLPALCNHLEASSGFFQTLLAENDGVLDGPGSHSAEAVITGACFQLLTQAVLTIFSWNGFQMSDNRSLLKEALKVLINRIRAGGPTQMSMKDVCRLAMQYIANFANTAPDIYTAVTLLKLLISLAEKADDQTLMKKLVPLAEDFLKREWTDSEGQREKGAKFNEQLQFVIKIYITQSEDPLSTIETIATKGIPELLEADKNGYSASFPTLTRSSYPVYYRVLFTELLDAVKTIPPVRQTDLVDSWMDRLLCWNVSVRILHILVNLIKTFDSRGCLGTCIKYGRFFVEAFLRQGMPLLDKMFKNHKQDITGLLKNLQQSTRFLHHMCGHSKIIKDIALTNQVPMMKRTLEVFVFRVKAMLTVNKCLEAFWMGNLKNKDLHGEEIMSQSVAASEAGGDSEGEALPEEEEELSDVELDNESTASNETGDNDVTDPEGSLSQAY